jgi:hypothetical protein
MLNSRFLMAAALVVAALVPASAFAAARSGKSQAVGSGLAYPTLNHSLLVNPTGLADAGNGSLQAGYRIDPKKGHLSFVSGGSAVGFGLGYRQEGASSVEEFGFAGRLSLMTLGATLRTQEFEHLDADIGANFELGSVRVTAVGRGVDAGFDRVDVGLGFTTGTFSFGFDAKKPLGSGDKTWLFDAGLSAGDDKVSAGFGYTFSYDGQDIQGGDIHAGISLGVTQGLAAEAFYRPASQEWASGDWVVGLKARF